VKHVKWNLLQRKKVCRRPKYKYKKKTLLTECRNKYKETNP
jgi:hypothetical protein